VRASPHLSRVDARGGRELGEGGRPQSGKPRLELLPQRQIGARELDAVRREPHAERSARHEALAYQFFYELQPRLG
jgi:hypothetical protein